MWTLQKRRSFFLILLLVTAVWAWCTTATGSDRLEYQYRRAQSSVERLLNSPRKQKYRQYWLACIDKFKAVYAAQPQGPWADDAIFMMARLYEKLYRHSFSKKDKQEALDYYKRLIKRFPKSRNVSRARSGLARLAPRRSTTRKATASTPPVKKGVTKPKGLTQVRAEHQKKRPQSGKALARVTDLRVWSNPDYTRVVVDVDQEVPFTYRLLKKDPTIGKPQRLYIDLDRACLDARVRPVVPIGDDLLSNARAAQHAPATVRVVLDIKSIEKFKIFSLKNPFRVVLDVNGVRKRTKRKTVKKPVVPKPGQDIPKGALAKQLALGVKRVVIDPGHGGKDPGALGYYKSILEKNVTLEVSRRLARKIREELGIEAILTRNRDRFLSLEERTALANTKNADLFLSIHANASKNHRCRGVETYFLNLATDNDAIMVAARENATSAKNISDLETILNDLMKNAKISESSRLAADVQRGVTRHLRKRFKYIRDNGVKQAPFYVLLGAEMPCVLIEIAFISNPSECRRLNTAVYQETLVEGIVAGIRDYIEEINPTALKRSVPGIQARNL
ncbi:MAG: N-acetylmuramoyl-L-alanine amidase [Deltaproteobacteria bacterium]|nr:N-acetylmuramoyl-L-alanine amidase [Deltaproteobacteria bacterium]